MQDFKILVHARLQNPIAIVYWSSSYETVPSKSRFDKLLLKLVDYCSSVRYKNRIIIFLDFYFDSIWSFTLQ